MESPPDCAASLPESRGLHPMGAPTVHPDSNKDRTLLSPYQSLYPQ